ncbi:MAG: hypothetical protein JRH20_24700 [Deltaproteobacteria bacterium]|nr:hypothetical protein [Deltaproteobacteria bacterium]
MSYLERYLAEEPQPLWQELLDEGDAVRNAGLAEDATAVATEAMARVHRNLQRILARLDKLGYNFTDRQAALLPPDPNVETLIASFETRVGPLPLALQAFYRVVGGVDWRGEMPGWSPMGPLLPDSPLNGVADENICYPDPLMIPTLSSLLDECEVRQDELTALERDEGLMVTFSPDYLGKTEPCGGLYGVLLPDPGLDTDLEVYGATTFTDYLRDALRWGGFPGLIQYQEPDVATVQALSAELESF